MLYLLLFYFEFEGSSFIFNLKIFKLIILILFFNLKFLNSL